MTKKFKENKEPPEEEVGVVYVTIPPDGGWGWVIVTASFICNFVAEGTMYSFGLFLKEIANSLQTTTTQVSLANSLMTGFYFFFGPVICAMINRWGYRVVGLIGGILGAISFVAASFATEVLTLILCYGFIGGVGFGMLYMPSVIAIGFYFERWRGVANSVSLCGSAVGSISIPLVIQMCMKHLEWQTKFRFFSGFAFFCALCTLMYKPLQPFSLQQEETDEKNAHLDVEESTSFYNSKLNKYNNQQYRRASIPGGKQPSFLSIKRAGSPNALSTYSFKSYASTTRSLFKGSRMVYSEVEPNCCASCCNGDNCRHTCKLLCCCGKHCTRNPTRPMYREDIFYTGSVVALPEYYKSFGGDPLDFHMSMTRVASAKDIMQDNKCFICCPEAIRRPMETMLDFGMLKSCAFISVAMSGFLTMLGFFVPLTYITAKCIKSGIDQEVATFMLSTFGIAHLFGRITCAVITFFPQVKALPVSIVFIVIAGAMTVICVIFNQEEVQFTFCALYGMSFAFILSLRPIIVVDLFGLEKLSNAFGIMMMFYGMACFSGIPIAGVLYDMTNGYKYPFYFAGGSIILGGIILIPVPYLLKYEKKIAEKKLKRRQMKRLQEKQRLKQQQHGPSKAHK